jgi:ABC-type nitrate/sulfonate/bicarbonate transport system substrate-binding protein
MDTGAWSIFLEGLSSYAGIASAYCLIRPALLSEHLRSSLELLQAAEQHPDARVALLAKDAKTKVQSELTGSLHRRRRWNRLGLVLLMGSAMLLAGAIVIHLRD